MENFKAKDLELTDVIDISVLFKTSAYIASNGKENKKYLLTKDGFTMIHYSSYGIHRGKSSRLEIKIH